MNAPVVTIKSTFDAMRVAALADIGHALARLHAYALGTDAPEHAAVEAADLLEAARDALERAP